MSFRRDRLTWLAYALLAWFAYLQAAPGLVVPYLRDELDIGYTTGGLHVAAFAAGSILAGATATRLEAAIGRRTLLWAAALGLAVGMTGLVVGPVVGVTVGSLLVAGWGGGLVLVTVQAILADHHHEQSAVALTEANVAASVAYIALVGAIALAVALGAGWRAAVLVSFAFPLVMYFQTRETPIAAPAPPSHAEHGALPRSFYVATGILFCAVGAEWCVTAWGASFAEEAADVSADTAVALMFGYFSGVLVGRFTGSRLARRHAARRLLALALAVTAVGFAILWPAASAAQTFAGLFVIGVGLGNLFPFALAVTLALVPGRGQLASSRAVLSGSSAVLLAPLTIGALADATSITSALLVVPVLLGMAKAGLVATRGSER